MRLQGISVFGLALCLSACASSGSLGSSSDIISSPFESLSKSSGGGDSAYLADVETLVLAYLDTPAAPSSFMRDLAQVAQQHGVSDWEADAGTTHGIGIGLRAGAATQVQVDAFIARYLTGLPDAADHVRKGYAAAPTA
jgi:hypothetical protein